MFRDTSPESASPSDARSEQASVPSNKIPGDAASSSSPGLDSIGEDQPVTQTFAMDRCEGESERPSQPQNAWNNMSPESNVSSAKSEYPSFPSERKDDDENNAPAATNLDVQVEDEWPASPSPEKNTWGVRSSRSLLFQEEAHDDDRLVNQDSWLNVSALSDSISEERGFNISESGAHDSLVFDLIDDPAEAMPAEAMSTTSSPMA